MASGLLPTIGFLWASGPFAETTPVRGTYIGFAGGSPRVLLANGVAAQNVQWDNTGSGMRWLYPGVVVLQAYSGTSPRLIAFPEDVQIGANDGTNNPAPLYVRTNNSGRPVVLLGQDFSGAATTDFWHLLLQKMTSTNARRNIVGIDTTWTDSTDATRKGRRRDYIYDTAARLAFQEDADGARGTASVPCGGSTSTARVGGSIFDHFVNAGNVTTGETDLYSDTLAASTLSVNGDKIEAQYAGVFVSSGTATRQVRVYFGGTLVFDTGTLTLSLSAAWDCFVKCIRVSASVVRVAVSLTTEGAALAAYTAYTEVTGLTLTNTQVLKITGQAAGIGAATNDIVAKLGDVKFFPAA
jgi:hypothetical protein